MIQTSAICACLFMAGYYLGRVRMYKACENAVAVEAGLTKAVRANRVLTKCAGMEIVTNARIRVDGIYSKIEVTTNAKD